MIKRIVLTGGPCAGKTTVLSRLEQNLREKGYKVFIVSESATELINGGITPHENGIGLFNFQKLIMAYQYQKEEIYNNAVINSKEDKIVIIYDRGIMDNKAYVSDKEFENVRMSLCTIIGREISVFDIVNRYDMVIHLVTSAGNKGYSLDNNKARYESEEEAILLDKRTMNAWINHNNLKIVDSKDDFEEKVNEVLNLVYNCLGEIPITKKEKKFLVDVNDEVITRLNGIRFNILQYYLSAEIDGVECRIRKVDYNDGTNYYYVLQKVSDCGIKSVLLERKITEGEFNEFLKFGVMSSVEKERICFTYNRQICKLDLFSSGLMLLEIEGDCVEDFPMGIYVLDDVTDDKQYRNFNLGELNNKSLKKTKI